MLIFSSINMDGQKFIQLEKYFSGSKKEPAWQPGLRKLTKFDRDIRKYRLRKWVVHLLDQLDLNDSSNQDMFQKMLVAIENKKLTTQNQKFIRRDRDHAILLALQEELRARLPEIKNKKINKNTILRIFLLIYLLSLSLNLNAINTQKFKDKLKVFDDCVRLNALSKEDIDLGNIQEAVELGLSCVVDIITNDTEHKKIELPKLPKDKFDENGMLKLTVIQKIFSNGSKWESLNMGSPEDDTAIIEISQYPQDGVEILTSEQIEELPLAKIGEIIGMIRISDPVVQENAKIFNEIGPDFINGIHTPWLKYFTYSKNDSNIPIKIADGEKDAELIKQSDFATEVYFPINLDSESFYDACLQTGSMEAYDVSSRRFDKFFPAIAQTTDGKILLIKFSYRSFYDDAVWQQMMHYLKKINVVSIGLIDLNISLDTISLADLPADKQKIDELLKNNQVGYYLVFFNQTDEISSATTTEDLSYELSKTQASPETIEKELWSYEDEFSQKYSQKDYDIQNPFVNQKMIDLLSSWFDIPRETLHDIYFFPIFEHGSYGTYGTYPHITDTIKLAIIRPKEPGENINNTTERVIIGDLVIVINPESQADQTVSVRLGKLNKVLTPKSSNFPIDFVAIQDEIEKMLDKPIFQHATPQIITEHQGKSKPIIVDDLFLKVPFEQLLFIPKEMELPKKDLNYLINIIKYYTDWDISTSGDKVSVINWPHTNDSSEDILFAIFTEEDSLFPLFRFSYDPEMDEYHLESFLTSAFGLDTRRRYTIDKKVISSLSYEIINLMNKTNLDQNQIEKILPQAE